MRCSHGIRGAVGPAEGTGVIVHLPGPERAQSAVQEEGQVAAGGLAGDER